MRRGRETVPLLPEGKAGIESFLCSLRVDVNRIHTHPNQRALSGGISRGGKMRHYQYCADYQIFNLFKNMQQKVEMELPNKPYRVGDIVEAIEIGIDGKPTGNIIELYISKVRFGMTKLNKYGIKLGRKVELKKLTKDKG